MPVAAPPRRAFSRVGAGRTSGSISLASVQAELAKRKAKGFSAFQFSSFSTSTFDDEALSAAIPANEAPAASHAAISHASTQVQVRTQLVTCSDILMDILFSVLCDC